MNQTDAKIVKLRDAGTSWPEIGRVVGMKHDTCRGRYRRIKRGSNPGKTRKRGKGRIQGKTLETFAAMHDIPSKIRVAIQEHLDEVYFTDDEFRQLCGVSVQNWRRNANLDEFKSYQYKKGDEHYWAQPDMVEAMQKMTGAAGA